MTIEKTLREGINVAFIEGTVKDVRIEEKEINGKDAISGEIDIQVAPEFVYTVNVFSYKMNQKGEISGLYKSYCTVRDEYKTIDRDGIEAADKVRIDHGKNGKNEYVGQDGEFKSYPQLSTTFINRVKENDVFEPKAKFTLEMVVAGTSEEKRGGEETGRLILRGYVPGYQEGKDDTKKIFPFEVIVAEPHSIQYVENTYEKGQTVKVFGDIVNQTIISKKTIEVGFGEPQEQIDRKSVREYIVTGGTPPMDEDDKNAFDTTLIKQALKKREEAIEKKKAEKKSKENQQQSSNGGFGGGDPFTDSGDPFDPFAN
ncbi:hypothetical protein GRF59_14825 [Paenibacillus sp. HJL G12]|uniref:Uncharacterized protein n=1 Tax=Paenibacillus dendrobii TaxID=2691084 RepID=A0A7X3IJY2_9BACL|nr:hypothetical protein [Paenibacillus dendrobii]MWV44893.1 hypothetical protein [Paenibacillus dendrobii]